MARRSRRPRVARLAPKHQKSRRHAPATWQVVPKIGPGEELSPEALERFMEDYARAILDELDQQGKGRASS